jgi:hypothetical protein
VIVSEHGVISSEGISKGTIKSATISRRADQ